MVPKSSFFVSESNDERRMNNRRTFLGFAAGAVVGTAAMPLLGQNQNSAVPSAEMFKGFKSQKIQTTGATINVVSGGQGPPLLLLHGNPETHVMWPQNCTSFGDRVQRVRRRFAGIWRQQ